MAGDLQPSKLTGGHGKAAMCCVLTLAVPGGMGKRNEEMLFVINKRTLRAGNSPADLCSSVVEMTGT